MLRATLITYNWLVSPPSPKWPINIIPTKRYIAILALLQCTHHLFHNIFLILTYFPLHNLALCTEGIDEEGEEEISAAVIVEEFGSIQKKVQRKQRFSKGCFLLCSCFNAAMFFLNGFLRCEMLLRIECEALETVLDVWKRPMSEKTRTDFSLNSQVQ